MISQSCEEHRKMTKQIKNLLMLVIILLTACSLAENQNANTNGSVFETRELPSATPEQIKDILELTPEATETVVETPVDNGLIGQWIEICESMEMEDCMLALTNYCDLPCLWGIVPGETHMSAFEDFVSTFGLITYISKPKNQMRKFETSIPLNDPIEGYQAYANLADFFVEEESETIQWVRFSITKDFARSHPLAYYEEYLPEAIFARYGIPSRIIFGVGFPADPPLDFAHYGLRLYYDELGFAIWYRGHTEYSKTLDICFSYSSDPFFPQYIYIYMKPVNDPSSLEEVMSFTNESPVIHTPSSKMFDELISMEIDEFVALFDGENPEVCFQMDLDAVKALAEE
jgi:hypothetical protein